MNLWHNFLNALKWGSQPARDPIIRQWIGLNDASSAGVYVNPQNAMAVSAVYACVKVISETLAWLPLVLYRHDGAGKRPDVQNPLYRLLYSSPNSWQTSFEFREMMMGHLLLRGNAFAEKVSSPRRGIEQLIPLHPDRVQVFRQEGSGRVYQYTSPAGEKRVLLPSEMFHVMGPGEDGLVGMNPLQCQREAIGLAITAQEFGARLFGNGTHLGGVLYHPKHLSVEAHENLKKTWDQSYQGVKKAGKTAILEEGMTFQTLNMTALDAQFLESRKFSVAEIARIFRVPPHKIADLERSTNNNIEHQSLEFVTDTMMPWLVRWEQAILRDLISDPTQHFVKFRVQALMRGDAISRSKFYVSMLQNGVMSPNEVRELEDLNPREGGDEYMQPLNMKSGADNEA